MTPKPECPDLDGMHPLVAHEFERLFEQVDVMARLLELFEVLGDEPRCGECPACYEIDALLVRRAELKANPPVAWWETAAEG